MVIVMRTFSFGNVTKHTMRSSAYAFSGLLKHPVCVDVHIGMSAYTIINDINNWYYAVQTVVFAEI